jgi:hypothetical protein
MRNKKQFLTNSEIYHINTRQASLHLPLVSVAKYNKGVYYQRTKVFNKLPSYIKIEFDNPKKFKSLLLKLLHENSFHFLNEYLDFKKN